MLVRPFAQNWPNETTSNLISNMPISTVAFGLVDVGMRLCIRLLSIARSKWEAKFAGAPAGKPHDLVDRCTFETAHAQELHEAGQIIPWCQCDPPFQPLAQVFRLCLAVRTV